MYQPIFLLPHSLRVLCIFSPFLLRSRPLAITPIVSRGTHQWFLCNSVLQITPTAIPCPHPASAGASLHVSNPLRHHMSWQVATMSSRSTRSPRSAWPGEAMLLACSLPSLSSPFRIVLRVHERLIYVVTYTSTLREGWTLLSLCTNKHIDSHYIIVQKLPPEYQVHQLHQTCIPYTEQRHISGKHSSSSISPSLL
ncbi:hypothetical protein BD289DRAFT_105077 [Coniella lustricola]|uniref:Uncharacterized protein n=1 Tax=Coniella lustricola TaxID=2025994 RepID=A0A2T2ZXS4_9PEZI|nr:hypothetical protein BD289DRAFT_105077 [Coniella lustricola]